MSVGSEHFTRQQPAHGREHWAEPNRAGNGRHRQDPGLIQHQAATAPGATVSLSVEPSPEMLPWRLSGYYTAEVPGDSFGLGSIEISDTGISFRVFERAVASSGTLKFVSDDGPFRGIVDRCEGAAQCSAKRSICSDLTSCMSGVAYGGGFDSLVLPASVAVEN